MQTEFDSLAGSEAVGGIYPTSQQSRNPRSPTPAGPYNIAWLPLQVDDETSQSIQDWCAVRTMSYLVEVDRLARRLFQLTRERGLFGMLQQARIWTLSRLHMKFIDPLMDQSEPQSVSKITQLSELKIKSNNVAEGVEYEPTPVLILNWIQQALPKNVSQWSFIDIGCGRGRAVMMAAVLPYRQVIGVEFSSELHADALHNLAKLTANNRVRCDTQILEADATTFRIPHGDCIFFLFNPFGPSVMRKFLNNVVRSYKDSPRNIILAYYNPKHADVVHEFKEFEERQPSFTLRLKFRFLAPNGFRMFELKE